MFLLADRNVFMIKCLQRDIKQLSDGPMDGHQHDYSVGKLVIGRKVKGIVFAQPREVKVQEGDLTSLPVPKRQLQR